MVDNPNQALVTPELLLQMQQFGKLWAWHVSWPSLAWRPMRGFVGIDGQITQPGEFHLTQVLEMYGPIHGPELERKVRAAFETGEPLSYLSEFEGVDDQFTAYQNAGEVELDADGKIVGLRGITRDVSAERRAIRELKRTRAMLEKAQQLGRMGHWHINERTGVLTWSDALYQMMGLDPGDPVSVDKFLAMVDEPSRAEIIASRRAALKAKTSISYKADVTLRDGRKIVIETLGEPEFGPDGALQGYFGTTQDITRRTMAERSAQENEQRLQRIFDAMDQAGVGIGVQDNDGLISEAHPALLAITGFAREEDVIGRKWSELQGSGGTDIAMELQDTIRQAIVGNSKVMRNVEVDWVRPDGEEISAMIRLAPMPGGERTMIVLDQTEQKRAQRELMAREMRTLSILEAIDASGVGYTVEDFDGRIITISPTLVDLLGMQEPSAYLGEKWTEIFELPRRIREQINVENAAYNDQVPRPFSYPEFQLELPDGREICLHARSTPLPGIGRLVLAMDVTERHRLTRRQADMDAHLQQVQKMEALGQLAGGIAHEINNMLHPIRTFARAAMVAETPEDMTHRLNRIVECADKAGQIVQETLSFARDSGRQLSRLDLVTLARSAVAFSRDMRQQNIELELVLPDSPLFARVNETEFLQVVLNLLQNASDSMAGQGIITISVTETGGLAAGSAAGSAIISIADNGPGMPPQIVDRIFEPFFTTKGPKKGTGLGLSVVYGIINRWQGQIDVISAPGEGTEIRLLLPLATT